MSAGAPTPREQLRNDNTRLPRCFGVLIAIVTFGEDPRPGGIPLGWVENTRAFIGKQFWGPLRGKRVLAPCHISPGETWECRIVDVDRRAILVTPQTKCSSGLRNGIYFQSGPMRCQLSLDWAIQISRQERKHRRTNRMTLRPGRDLRQHYDLQSPPKYGTTLDPSPEDDRYREWFVSGIWDPAPYLAYGLPRHFVE